MGSLWSEPLLCCQGWYHVLGRPEVGREHGIRALPPGVLCWLLCLAAGTSQDVLMAELVTQPRS